MNIARYAATEMMEIEHLERCAAWLNHVRPGCAGVPARMQRRQTERRLGAWASPPAYGDRRWPLPGFLEIFASGRL